jgi:hypothetical protein
MASSKLESASELESIEERIRRNQRSPEEVAKLAEGVPPFSYEDWQREAPPATPEELADWEEFLKEREAEREANLAREAGVDPVP